MNPKLSPTEIDTICSNLQLCYPKFKTHQIRTLLEFELGQASNSTKELLLSKLAYLLEKEQPSLIVVQDDVIDVTTPEKERESSHKLKRDNSFTRITEFFPDADESYVRDLINKAPIDNIEESVSNSLIENKYPKKIKATPVSPPPKETSIDYNKYDIPVSVQYRHLCVIQLANEFPLISMKDIRNVTNKYNGHYTPSRKNLLESKNFKLNKKSRPIAILPAVDVEFERELKWVKDSIALDREKQDLELAQKLNETEYEISGQAIDCSCCFGSFPLEEMVQCADGHLFCGGCLKKYVEESLFGVGRAALHCMSSEGCKESFPDSQVKKVLPPLLYEKWEQRLQQEEILKAGITNLVSCPFCDFKIEVENPDDKVLKCQNSSCMKESCRLCKEENHIPLRCDEVETKKQAQTRVSIEEVMTEALLRMCPKCGVKFYKTEGCNKMTCTCGTSICYICKTHIPNKYEHFCKCAGLVDGMETGKCRKCGKCLVHTKDTIALDSNRVKAAEQEAKRKLDPPAVVETPKKKKL